MNEWMDIVQNKYLVSFYAVIVWYGFHFVIRKDKEDDKNGSFKISRWWKKTWDNVFLTFLAAPFVVLFDAEILWLFNFYQGDEKFNAVSKLVYISAGPLVSIIIIAIKKWRK